MALASEVRAHKAERSCGPRLPNELWCMTWSQLPVADCVTVTQVCHEWRGLALAMPRLWRSLEFTSSRHHEHCTCEPCAIEQNLCGRCRKELQRRSTDLRSISRLLLLSRDLAFRLDVTLQTSWADLGILQELAAVLRPHAARLYAVYFRSDDDHAVGHFLACYEALPTLRILVSESGDMSYFEACGVFQNTYRYPPSLVWTSYPRTADELSFPAVRSFRTSILRGGDIVSLFRALPSVENLRIRVSGAKWSRVPRVPDIVTQGMSKLASIHISGMNQHDEAHCHRHVSMPGAPKIRVGVRRGRDRVPGL